MTCARTCLEQIDDTFLIQELVRWLESTNVMLRTKVFFAFPSALAHQSLMTPKLAASTRATCADFWTAEAKQINTSRIDAAALAAHRWLLQQVVPSRGSYRWW